MTAEFGAGELRIKRAKAQAWNWQRKPSTDETVGRAVARMVHNVRHGGDATLRGYTSEFDRIAAAQDADWDFRVEPDRLREAWNALDGTIREALEAAADRIRAFHAACRPEDVERTGSDGDRLGMTWRALERVGVYAPGGRAAYPSTVLMNVIPAQVAGVAEIALVSPPTRETGYPHPLVLAAAHLLGVTEVYRVGGAQAVAALAYGTESIRSVDKIVGPGNLYVALAKRSVMGDVGIDSIAGPSEVFIVADETANPAFVAADMLAQAEHDPEAGAVCVTTDAALADAVEAELHRQLATLPKADIARQALEAWGAFVIASSLDEAIDVVNRSAPEHVELLVQSPQAWLGRVRCGGAVFLGEHSPEPVGDYYAGTNHVLPTHGSARYASGLGVHDFLRRMTYVEYARETLTMHAPHIVRLAEAEGLHAHARAVQIRIEGGHEG